MRAINQTLCQHGNPMSTFEGTRSIDGLLVTVDGKPLDPHYDVKQFTSWGFEWTYKGESPQQLALAILYEHLKDPARAIRLSDPFMRKVVANLDNDWILTGAQIDLAIAEIEGGGMR
jgi:Family of unknown function (DUF6166)